MSHNSISDWLLRIGVLFKRQLRTPAFYAVAVLMLAVQLILGTAALPSADNTAVGIFSDESTTASAIAERLLSESGTYRYQLYNSRDELKEAVAGGRIDCGFVLDERIDAALSSENKIKASGTDLMIPNLKGTIDYITSTSTTKGEAVKEAVFACLLDVISPQLLSDAVRTGTIFKDADETTVEQVLDEMTLVEASGSTFNVAYARVNHDGHITTLEVGENLTAEGETAYSDSRNSSVKAVTGILIFAAALLFASSLFHGEERALIRCFRSRALLFQTLGIFVPLLLTGAALSPALLICGTNVLHTAILLPYIAVCAAWTALFVRLFRHEAVYLFITVLLIIGAILLNPSFSGLSGLISSVSWIRYLLPTTWYSLILT